MGYHTRDISKGTFGDFDKVVEEWEELLDARLQEARVLELCELADLYGAIEGYVSKHFNLTMQDIAKMATLTGSAFEDGTRCSLIPNETTKCERCEKVEGIRYVHGLYVCDVCSRSMANER